MSSEMYCLFLFVVVFSCSVVSEDCMTFNFENGLEDFNNEGEYCEGLDMWKIGNYSDVKMDGFHSQSSVFAFPLSSLSCISSPMFQIKSGGSLEINLYLKPNVLIHQLVVFISQYVDGMVVVHVIENLVLKEGWQSINITVGSDSYLGFVTLMGVADSSALLLDSIRYIPPSSDEEECQMYKDVEVMDPEENKKPSHSIFYMKMGIVKIFN